MEFQDLFNATFALISIFVGWYLRAARNEKFAPLDIKATIPTEAVAAESVRQVIREEDALLQIHMDNASSAEELKALLPE